MLISPFKFASSHTVLVVSFFGHWSGACTGEWGQCGGRGRPDHGHESCSGAGSREGLSAGAAEAVAMGGRLWWQGTKNESLYENDLP